MSNSMFVVIVEDGEVDIYSLNYYKVVSLENGDFVLTFHNEEKDLLLLKNADLFDNTDERTELIKKKYNIANEQIDLCFEVIQKLY